MSRAGKCQYTNEVSGLLCYNPGSRLYMGKKLCHHHADRCIPTKELAQYHIVSHDLLLNRIPIPEEVLLKWVAAAVNHPNFEPANPWHMLILRAVPYKTLVYKAVSQHHVGEKLPVFRMMHKLRNQYSVKHSVPAGPLPRFPPLKKKRKKKFAQAKPFRQIRRIRPQSRQKLPKHGY